jgi:hypothetical protein
MNKPPRSYPKPLRDIVGKTFADAFRKQGFASAEIVTRWAAIVGAEIASCSEPMKIQWPRTTDDEEREPGTLVLRVEGPAAVEIQHQAGVICESINRFLGWRAVDRIALRQAPLSRPAQSRRPAAPDAEATARLAATLADIADEDLRAALARLGAAVRRK